MNIYYPNIVNLFLVILTIYLWFKAQKFIGGKNVPSFNNFFDYLHVWSTPINEWLNNHLKVTNILLIITSFIIDVTALFLLGSAIFGSTLQPFLALVIVMTLRFICQLIFTLPTPKGIIWHNPGFPSLFVTYGVSNDFFFSGHTAVAMLGLLQIMQSAPLWFVFVCFILVIVQAVSMIVLRAHYTIDVFAAVVVAWIANMIAIQIAPILDFWIHSLF
ncbi:MAG: phosphatase PAP2-related protein [Candidatus Paceibacterota bacterium]|jgi:membrane-associated phospholipid phosphatase